MFIVILEGRVLARFTSRGKAQAFIAQIDPFLERDIEVVEVKC